MRPGTYGNGTSQSRETLQSSDKTSQYFRACSHAVWATSLDISAPERAECSTIAAARCSCGWRGPRCSVTPTVREVESAKPAASSAWTQPGKPPNQTPMGSSQCTVVVGHGQGAVMNEQRRMRASLVAAATREHGHCHRPALTTVNHFMREVMLG
jgi:hypothetical protein